MRIESILWLKRLFRDKSETWRIRITLVCSEEEIQNIRDYEALEILEKVKSQ
jgi:hypothetical protein